MVQERRYCPDIIVQLRAIRAAVAAIETDLLDGHLDSCVTDTFNAGELDEKRKKMNELKDLYHKYNTGS